MLGSQWAGQGWSGQWREEEEVVAVVTNLTLITPHTHYTLGYQLSVEILSTLYKIDMK